MFIYAGTHGIYGFAFRYLQSSQRNTVCAIAGCTLKTTKHLFAEISKYFWRAHSSLGYVEKCHILWWHLVITIRYRLLSSLSLWCNGFFFLFLWSDWLDWIRPLTFVSQAQCPYLSSPHSQAKPALITALRTHHWAFTLTGRSRLMRACFSEHFTAKHYRALISALTLKRCLDALTVCLLSLEMQQY